MGLSFLINLYVYVSRLLGGCWRLCKREQDKLLESISIFSVQFHLSLLNSFQLDYTLTTLLKLFYLWPFL